MIEPTPRFWEIFFEVYDALAVLDQIAQEPEMHRRHGQCYAYEFFSLDKCSHVDTLLP